MTTPAPEPTGTEPTASVPAQATPPAAEPAPTAPPVAPAAPASPPAAVVPVAAQVQTFPDGKPMFDATGRPASPRSRLVAALLCWFLGVLGVHRFYVGKVGTGIAMIFTLGGLGVWALIDFIMILVGSFRDKEERVLANW